MITRRTFIGFAGLAGASALASFTLSGCSQNEADEDTAAQDSTATDQTAPAEQSAAQSEEQPVAAPAATAAVVYFSRAGENYGVGVVEEGNTAIVAKQIAKKAGADLFEIVPKKAYPKGYDDCCDVALDEQNEGARPAYTCDADLSKYETVYLGYPIWWGDLPMCVYSFIEHQDWSGKTVCPFCTHAGSGDASTPETLQSVCSGAEVGKCLSMTGATAQTDRKTMKADVKAWL